MAMSPQHARHYEPLDAPGDCRTDEDVATWNIKMNSEEVFSFTGVLRRGQASTTIYRPGTKGQDGVLFTAENGNINRIKRVDTSSDIGAAKHKACGQEGS